MVDHAPDLGLRIGQLAKVCGKTVRAIRHYESLSLITPRKRSDGGFREYPLESIEVIKAFDALNKAGFEFTQLQQLLQDAQQHSIPHESMAVLRNALHAYQQRIAEQLKHLQEVQKEIEHSLVVLEDCQKCTQTNGGLNSCSNCETPQRNKTTKAFTHTSLSTPERS
jgi:DNA-binding transcriptional MerR regulator